MSVIMSTRPDVHTCTAVNHSSNLISSPVQPELTTVLWVTFKLILVVRTCIICDRLREKEQFPARVDFAIITPKVGGVNFGRSHLSTPGYSRIRYLAAGTNTSAIHP